MNRPKTERIEQENIRNNGAAARMMEKVALGTVELDFGYNGGDYVREVTKKLRVRYGPFQGLLEMVKK